MTQDQLSPELVRELITHSRSDGQSRRQFLQRFSAALVGLGSGTVATALCQPMSPGPILQDKTKTVTTRVLTEPTKTYTAKSYSGTNSGTIAVSKTGTRTYPKTEKKILRRARKGESATTWYYTRKYTITYTHSKTDWTYTRTWPSGTFTGTPYIKTTTTVKCNDSDSDGDEPYVINTPNPGSIDALRGRGDRCDLA